jgi:hypothetical protein
MDIIIGLKTMDGIPRHKKQLRHGTPPVVERWRFDFTSPVSFLLDWLG